MKGATTIQERLWELRKDKGLNLEELSELTGISKSALGSYEKEDYKEINHGNLITLADFYGVSVDYLLCRTENREQINTPLTELHLNDEMVALLKSGRINNRLLCELATHKDFIKFLADIEIYVDGIATMQIQNLNALVDTVRHKIIERYRPGEDDPHLKVHKLPISAMMNISATWFWMTSISLSGIFGKLTKRTVRVRPRPPLPMN